MSKSIVVNKLVLGNELMGYRFDIFKGFEKVVSLDVDKRVAKAFLSLVDSSEVKKGRVIKGRIESDLFVTNDETNTIQVTSKKQAIDILERYYYSSQCSDIEDMLDFSGLERVRNKRSLEKVLDKLYGDFIKNIKGAYIVKTAHNENAPEDMELKYDVHFKSYEDLEVFDKLVEDFTHDLDCKNQLCIDTDCKQAEDDYAWVKFVGWNADSAYKYWLKECAVVNEVAPLLGFNIKGFDFNEDLKILSGDWYCGNIE